jgi:hypothetical protein
MLKRIVMLAIGAALTALAAAQLPHIAEPAKAQTPTQIQPQIKTQIDPKVIATAPKIALLWPAGTPEPRAWEIARQRDTIEAYEAFMRDYPDSPNFNAARDRRRELLRTSISKAQKKSPNGIDRGVIVNPPESDPPSAVVQPTRPEAPDIVGEGPQIILNAPATPPPPSPLPLPRPDGEVKTRTYSLEKEEAPQSAPGSAAPPTAPGPGPGPSVSRPGQSQRTVVTAAMTDLLPNMDRRAQNGGAAMVLLTTAARQTRRNQVLCDALYRNLTTATTDEIAVGARRVDGVVQVLRPVYWFVRGNLLGVNVRNEGCPTRLSTYHFARAGAVMRALNLSGEGPFLAVVRTDDRAAGVIDLSRASDAEIEQWVLYFRDSYSKRDRIWAPQNSTPDQTRRDLVAYFGESVVRALSTAPRVVFR